MTAPDKHARFMGELQAADDEELNRDWTTQAEWAEADRICGAIEKWTLVLLFVLVAVAFRVCAERWWWCGFPAIGSLAFAGLIARHYERCGA